MGEEKLIQNAILREFATRPEMRLWRANVGTAVPISFIKLVERAIIDADRNSVLNMMKSMPVIQFGIKGQADLTGILPGGTRLEIEVKSEEGRQSGEQEVYGNMITSKGGLYVLARSVGDVADAIKTFVKRS